MWWRVCYGLLRLILGISLVHLVGKEISEYIYMLMSHEITGRTGDMILEQVYDLFEIHDVTITYFIAGYFIFWGTLDVILSLSLLHRIRVAFPITMGLIVLFILYSSYRFTYTHSDMLLTIIIADIIILYLVNREYKKLDTPIPEETSTPSDPLPHLS